MDTLREQRYRTWGGTTSPFFGVGGFKSDPPQFNNASAAANIGDYIHKISVCGPDSTVSATSDVIQSGLRADRWYGWGMHSTSPRSTAPALPRSIPGVAS